MNVIETWDEEQIYAAAMEFLASVQRSGHGRQVFVTDMYYNRHDFEGDQKAGRLRGAIRRCAAALSGSYGDRLHYINGLEAMNTPPGLSSDGIHPSDSGHGMIAERLHSMMKGFTP